MGVGPLFDFTHDGDLVKAFILVTGNTGHQQGKVLANVLALHGQPDALSAGTRSSANIKLTQDLGNRILVQATDTSSTRILSAAPTRAKV
jgi:hypothetical protein